MLPTRPTRAVIVALLAVAAIACGDPTKPKASLPSALTSYALYPFTGAPASGATAISFLGGGTAARTDATFTFDVAFDLDPSGHALVYPVRAVAGDLAGPLTRVGLQVVPGAFDAIREVPVGGYDTLSVQSVIPGAVLAVELLGNSSCLYSFGGQFLYAKIVVDSVTLAPRRLYVRSVVDRNCGYRQVVPDSIPTS